MTSSGLQTSIQAATFPRIRAAAPSGARPILVLLLLFFATPLCAEAPLRTIEVSMMFHVCRDRIRIAANEGMKLTGTSTLADFGVRPEDLNGEVTDASNYGMYVETVEPPVIVLVYRKRLEFQDSDRNARLNLDTWALYEHDPREVSVDLGGSIWPGAKHDHALARQRYEERIRCEWLELLDAWPFLLVALIVSLASWRNQTTGRVTKLGLSFVSFGCAIVAYVLLGSPTYHYMRESSALVVATIVGVSMLASGVLTICPRTADVLFLHFVASVVVSVIWGAWAASEVRSGIAGLAVLLGLLASSLSLSLRRFILARGARNPMEPA